MKFDIGFATLYALCYGEGVSGTEEERYSRGRGEGLSLSRGAGPIKTTPCYQPSILCLLVNATLPVEVSITMGFAVLDVMWFSFKVFLDPHILL